MFPNFKVKTDELSILDVIILKENLISQKKYDTHYVRPPNIKKDGNSNLRLEYKNIF